MADSLPKEQKLIPISEAAEILGVSIDTIRRWDKTGILHAERPDGKNRYFSLAELEKVKFSKPLSISDAAVQLGVSQSTLRRLEKKGFISPQRTANGERIYTKEVLETFLHSEYFLRQKEVEEKILEPLKGPEVKAKLPPKEEIGKEKTVRKILAAVVEEHGRRIAGLIEFRKVFYAVGLFFVTFFILAVSIITVAFLLFPQETAHFFGYFQTKSLISEKSNPSRAVLGAKYPVTTSAQEVTVVGKTLKPFSRVSLEIVKQVNEEVYKQVVPERRIEDINDVLTIDEEGNLTPKVTVKLPDSSYLEVPDVGLVNNLNASYVRGKVVSDGEGEVAIIKQDGTITNLVVNTANITNGSVTSAIIANGTITTEDIADKAITSAKLADGVSVGLSDDSVLSKHIKDGEVKTADIADGAVTSAKISDDTITASDLSSTLTFSSGDFLDLSAITQGSTSPRGLRLPNASSSSPSSPSSGEGYLAYDTAGDQLIVYNGSSWATVSGSGGISGSGVTNFLSKWTSSSAIGISSLFDNGNVGIGTTIPGGKLVVMGGNVGIGTTSPLQALEVVGSIKSSSLTTLNGVLYADNTGLVKQTATGGAGTLCLTSVSGAAPTFDSCTSGTPSGWSDFGGVVNLTTLSDYVGIGLSAPVVAKLQVQGAGTGTGLTFLTTGSTGNLGFAVLDNGNVGIGTTNLGGKLIVMGGNVGIGTTSPLQALEVVGSIRSSSFANVNGVLYADATGTLQQTATGGAGTLCLTSVSGAVPSFGSCSSGTPSGWSDNGGVINLTTSTDYVGIGSSTAAGKLTIQGAGTGTGLAFLINDSSGIQRFAITDSGNVGIGTTNLSLGKLLVFGGNVGIGTSTPGSLLQVSGNGVFGFGANSVVGPLNGLAVLGNVGIGTSSPAFNFQVGGTAFVSSTLRSGNEIVGFAGTPSGPANGLAVFGNVGVGTTSPIYPLQVVGAANVTGNVDFDSLASGGLIKAAAGTGRLSIATSGTDYEVPLTFTNGLTRSVNTITLGGTLTQATTINQNNNNFSLFGSGNVGIGTSLPGTAKLAVIGGNLGVGTSSPLVSLEGAGSISAGVGYRIANQAVSGTYLRGNGTDFVQSAILFGDLPATAQGWTDNGGVVNLTTSTDYVGIGLSGPVAGKLTVQGAGASTGLAFLIRDSSSVERFAITDSGNVGIGTTNLSSAKLAIFGGNVGIGTSTPGATLQNAGNEVIGFGANSVAGPANGLAVFGNVGVGTTSPIYPLQVVGAANVTGNVDFDSLASGGLVKAAAGTGRLSIASSGTDYEVPLTFTNGLTRSVNTITLGGTLTQATTINQNNNNFSFFGVGNVGIGTSAPGTAKLAVIGGNVGVGTTSPLSTLEVAGNLRVSGTTTLNQVTYTWSSADGGSGQVLSTNGSGVLSWITSGSGNSGWTDNGGVVNLTTASDYVGIGVSAPVAKLTVQGTGNSTGLTLLTTDSSGTARLAVLDNGNVGVGLTGPTTKLSVFGDNSGGVTIGSYLFATSAAPVNGLAVSGNVGIGTTSPGVALSVVGSISSSAITTQNGVLYSDQTGVIKQTAQGGAGTLCLTSVGGAVPTFDSCTSGTPSGWSDFGGVVNLTTASDYVGIGLSAPVAAKLQVQGAGTSTGLTFLTTGSSSNLGLSVLDNGNVGIGTTDLGAAKLSVLGGNVGIGTTSPIKTLDIAGSLLVAGTTTLNSVTYTWPGGDGTSGQVLSTNGSGTLSWATAASGSSGWTDNGGVVNLTTSTDYVGIGVSAPVGKLTIQGVGTSTGLTFLTTGSSGNLGLVVLDNGNVGIGTTSPSAKLAVLGGNVGIGTTSPGYPFQVAGAANISGSVDLDSLSSGGLVKAAAGTGRLSIASSGTDYEVPLTFTNGLTRSSNTITLGGTLTQATTINQNNNNFSFFGVGNVGIGTSAPGTAKLAVLGGNVGIGTTSPGAALEVVGNGIFSGDVQVNGGDITSTSTTLTLGGSITTLNCTDCIDFDDLADALSLDANTSLTQDGSETFTITNSGSGNTIINLSSTGDFEIQDNGALFVYFTDTGNVGIGTSSPGARLAVAGGGLFGYTGTQSLSSGTTLGISGNVGIGTTSPGYNLQVVGTTNITGATTLGNTLTVESGGLTITAGALAVNSDSITSDGALVINATTTDIQDALTADSLTLDTGSLTFSGVTTDITTATNEALTITAAGTGDIFFELDGDTIADFNGGNVGIGTSTPGSLLQVAGNGVFGFGANSVAGPLNGLAVLGNVGIGTSSPAFNFQVGGTAFVSSTLRSGNEIVGFAGTPTGPANGLAVSGNVGVGTTSPLVSLEAAGSISAGVGYRIANQAASGTYLRGNGTDFVQSAIQFGDLPATAQGWTDNGGVVNLTTSTDYVGIGLSGPVAGKLTVQGAGASTGLAFLIRDSNGIERVAITDSGNVGIGTTNLSSAKLAVFGGNVGIGTSTPGSQLQLAGNAVLGFGANSVAGPTNGLAILGNVGIGTTSPSFNLQVVGTANITGATTLGSALTVETGGITVTAGGLTITAGALAVNSDSITSDGALVINATTTDIQDALTADSLTLDTGSLTFSGVTTDITTAAGEALTLTAGTTGDIFFELDSDTIADFNGGNVGIGTSSPGARLAVAGGTILGYSGTQALSSGATLGISGNVGIGTTSPAYNLQVVGTANITGATTLDGQLLLADGSNAAPALAFAADTNTGLYRIDEDRLSLVTAGASALTINSSGNVGIGSTSPGTNKLYVTGGNLGISTDGSSTSSPRVGAFVDLTSGEAARFQFGDDANAFQNSFNGRMQIYSYWGLELLGSRQVLGTPPTFVTGATNDPAVLIAGTSTFNATTRHVLVVRGAATQNGNLTEWQNSSGTGLSAINASGNLGIGTSTPGSALQITGGAVIGFGAPPVTAPTGGLYVGGNVGIGTSASLSSAKLAVLGGNVGIGTSSPINNLEVVGTSLVTGAAKFASGLSVGNDTYRATNPGAGSAIFSGNIGIGTTSPIKTLDIAGTLLVSGTTTLNSVTYTWPGADGSSGQVLSTNASGTLSWATAASSAGFTDNGGVVNLTTSTDYVGIGLSAPVAAKLQVQGAGTGTGLTFLTTGSTGNLGLAVLDNGNVGIGTTAATDRLEVISSQTGSVITAAFRANPGATGATNYNSIVFDNTFGATNLKNQFSFRSQGSERWVFGNDVNGAGNQNFFIYDAVAGGSAGTRFVIDSSGNAGIGTGSGVIPSGLGGKLIVIGGNVGIGTSSPGALLSVAGGGLFGYSGTQSLASGTTLGISGNVGIGTTSPAYNFQVAGTANVLSTVTFSNLVGCDTIDTNASGVLSCGSDAGAGASPFAAAGGVITKSAATDFLSLRYGDAADVQLEIENTTAGTVPTADAMQINLSGGTGVVTDGVDGLSINIEGADGTTNTVSALRLNFDPISASGDETFVGLNIEGITATSAREAAIQTGAGWDYGLLIDGGNVGIGTSSPGARLAVAGGGLFGYSGTQSLASGTTLGISGNVGIGTTSPAYQLHATGNVGIGGTLSLISAQYASCTALKTNASGDVTCGGAVDSVTTNVYTSGSPTWSRPANTEFAQVIVTGGGAGGGTADTDATTAEEAAGGGGAGGTAIRMLTAALLGSSQSVSVGIGGTGPAAVGTGGGGQSSSFGSLLSATGGSGGVGDTDVDSNAGDAFAGGAGGAGSGGDVNLTGGEGGSGSSVGEESMGGHGGASYWGGGGMGGTGPIAAVDGADNGNNGVAPGSGGGGGANEDSATAGVGGNGANGIVVVFSYTGSGGDIAEWYETKEGVEPGDVVAISEETLEYESFALGLQKTAILEKAIPGSSVVGVVSTLPFQVVGGDLLGASKNAKPIALAGRVPVKVSEENGKIKAGDLLTVSSTPGVAMRATKAGMTIGRALEDSDCSSTELCKILVLVNTSYSSGILLKEALKEDGLELDTIPADFDVGRAILAKMIREKEDIMASSTLSEIYTDRIAAGLEVITPRVLTSNITFLSPDGETTVALAVENGRLIVKDAQNNTTIAFDAKSGSGYFAGELVAKVIKAERIEGLEVYTNRLSDLSELVDKLATSSASQGLALRGYEASASAEASSSADILLARLEELNRNFETEASSSSQLELDRITAVASLTSVGKTFLANTNIAGSLTIGTIVIDDLAGSINTISELKLQNSPLSGDIAFVGGKVKITREGDLAVEGVITTQELKIAVPVPSEATGSGQIADAVIGEGVIKVGQTAVAIRTTKVKASSKIFITPTSPTSQPLFVRTRVEDTSFTVEMKQPESGNITFDWWIVNTEPITLGPP